MRWQGRRESDNVEDRRGSRSKTMVGGGIGTLVIVLLVYLLGGDPQQILENASTQETQVAPYTPSAEENEMAKFVAVVLGDTEDVWEKLFQQAGETYRKPKLVLYTDLVQSSCGRGSAATGPFYCPGDEKVYIDLAFFEELRSRFRAPGDFAIAYVIAHEIGHHVQQQLGIMDKLAEMQSHAGQRERNQLDVRLELQADFLAGVWAHHAQQMHNILEEGDIEEALNAASAVGDDRIQKQSTGRIVPDAFTHGSSDQRVRWFTRGFKTGDLNQGDTFAAETL
jgi:uncharacterized protein